MSTTRDRRRDIDEEDEHRRRRISREIIRIESEEDEATDESEEGEEDDEEREKRTKKREKRTKIKRAIKQSDTEEEDNDDEENEDEEDEEDEENEGGDEHESKPLWQHIITGGFIAGDFASQYYRYLIAIAVMCFISIFLTFMSLNADDEYRRKEKHLTLLRERSVLKSEERYRISSRDEVVKRLDKEFGIEMIEQKNSLRMQ